MIKQRHSFKFLLYQTEGPKLKIRKIKEIKSRVMQPWRLISRGSANGCGQNYLCRQYNYRYIGIEIQPIRWMWCRQRGNQPRIA